MLPIGKAWKIGSSPSLYPKNAKEVADQLASNLASLPYPQTQAFPILLVGREYRLAQLPARNLSALGYEMIAAVEQARKAPISGYFNRDEDMLAAQGRGLERIGMRRKFGVRGHDIQDVRDCFMSIAVPPKLRLSFMK